MGGVIGWQFMLEYAGLPCRCSHASAICMQVILCLDSDAKKMLAGLQKQVLPQGVTLRCRARCMPQHKLLFAASHPAIFKLPTALLQLDTVRQLVAEEARKSAASGGAFRYGPLLFV